MTIRLSICIATFNRGKFIGETLESIIEQANEETEIVILDGGSSDNTEQAVRYYQERASYLRYVRQDKNNGVDRDFNTAVELARGKYCWLMSDDDLLKPNAIAEVLGTLRQEFSLVVVNSELMTSDFSNMLDYNRMRLSSNRAYLPDQFESLFEEQSAYLTYIGAVVINRELWLNRDKHSYFGSNFIHVGVIFQAKLPQGAIALSTPLIRIRFGNTQWRPREFEIRMIRWTDLIWGLPTISDEVKKRCYPREPWRSVKSLMFYRAKGTYSWTEYRRWVGPRLTRVFDKAKAIGIALFPGVIANAIGLVYCSLDYRDSNIHLLDMKISRFHWRRLSILAHFRPSDSPHDSI